MTFYHFISTIYLEGGFMSNKINEKKYYDINLLFESIKLTTGLEINELINFF